MMKKLNGALSLESAAFDGGRFIDGEMHYFFTDHLGSTRAAITISEGDGISIVERNDYYPFGKRYGNTTNTIPNNKYRYSNKEEQSFVNVPYLDYGARMYDPQFRLSWNGVDPLAEKYYGISPYAFCAGNPINRIDSDGRADDWYFNTTGTLLGEDNKETDYIRIINTEVWNINADNGKIDAGIGEASSTLFSDTNLSDNASLNIYQYFNVTGLPLQVNNMFNGSMETRYSIGHNKYNDEFEVANFRLSINIQYNKASKLFDTGSNIRSSFEHEWQHINDAKMDTRAQYYRTRAQKELRAIEYQQSTGTYLKTTPAYKDVIENYKKINQLK